MPNKDGTGPRGGGSGRGRGQKKGAGRGIGQGRNRRGSGGMGRGGGNMAGAGPGGKCICSECGNKVAHQVGVPCYSTACPKCGAKMLRE